MRRSLFEAEHVDFGEVVRKFIRSEVTPVFGEWEAAGETPRQFFRDIAALGVTGLGVPEEYGGTGAADYRYNVAVQEAAAAELVTLGTLRTQLDVILPYFLHLADDEQQQRWLPGIAAGELLTAIALTEPGTGSDLAGVRTNAVRDRGDYVINGAKTFITGGGLADLVIVLARTAPLDPTNRRAGLSLFVVESGMPGFERGRKLEKLGLRTQDTVELSFDGVRVPAANRLGEEGAAFDYLRRNLAQERLAIAVGAVALADAAVTTTVGYTRERSVFGASLASMQNTKFELAAVSTEVAAARCLVDAAVSALVDGVLDPSDAARAKLFATETQGRVIDRCLQLFGGYGYIREYPIARLYADARVTRIYAGTSEVMKSIISKSLGL